METLREILSYALYSFLAVAALGAVVAFFKEPRRSPREALSNFVIYAMSKSWRDYVMRSIEVAILVGVYAYAPYKLPMTAWALALTLLAADFVYYWKHRSEHGVRLLWAYHSVHHSSTEYNRTTAFRLPWLGSLLGLTFYLPMVLMGFHPLMVILARQLVLLYQFWIHTEKVGSLGWFDGVFNSPSNHRVHHGSNRIYLDRKHGGILIIWDRLFGTYQKELSEVPVVYGLTHPLGTRNPLLVNMHEPIAIVRDVRAASSVSDAVGYVFRGPGWKPAPLAY